MSEPVRDKSTVAGQKYKCDCCGQEFVETKTRTDAETEAESLAEFGPREGEWFYACDECYERFRLAVMVHNCRQ